MKKEKMDVSLSVFFPCFNEEENIERTTLAALTACRALVHDFEVIVVNDGSSDRTVKIAEALATKYPEVRVVHHASNQGYGKALRTGFTAARKDWVFYTDGDGQFDFEELSKLLALAQPDRIVAGYRMRRQDPWHRKANAWLWNHLVNRLFDLKIRDVDCAFKLFPTRIFRQVELHSTGALIDTEVLVHCRRLNYDILQVGVSHFAREGGCATGANWRVILRAFCELFALQKQLSLR